VAVVPDGRDRVGGRPAGAVRARAVQRRPVVAGARATCQGDRARPAAEPRDGGQQGGRGPIPAGGAEHEGSDGLGSASKIVGVVLVVGHQRQQRGARVERRVHVFHVRQRRVSDLAHQKPGRRKCREG